FYIGLLRREGVSVPKWIAPLLSLCILLNLIGLSIDIIWPMRLTLITEWVALCSASLVAVGVLRDVQVALRGDGESANSLGRNGANRLRSTESRPAFNGGTLVEVAWGLLLLVIIGTRLCKQALGR